MMDSILKKFGLKFEDLRPGERETLYSWTESLQQNQLTVDGVKAYISAMKDTVEQELTKVNHNSKEDLFLKARLRNYLLLEAFLTSPEKAKKALERAVAGIVSNK